MNPDLAKSLAEHSPQLLISRPVLIPSPNSQTGWLLVTPSRQEAAHMDKAVRLLTHTTD